MLYLVFTLSILTNISLQLVDNNILDIDSDVCNTLLPFSFAKTSLQMYDWDFSNFADSYTRPNDGSNQMPYKNDNFGYLAIIYKDETNNLFVGVTYETLKQFKWLKQISNAKIGSAAVKLAQNSVPTNPSMFTRDVNQTSTVNVLYEVDNTNFVQYIQFDYYNGTLLKSYQINKGVSETSIKMTAALVFNKLYPEIHFLMSFKTTGAVELIIQLNGNSNPYQIMNYKEQINFTNTDFSNLLGISAASKSELFNEILSLVGTNFYSANNQPYSYYSFYGGLSYFNGYQSQNWYYSATAFRTSLSIYWYVQMKYDVSNTQPIIQEFSYPLTSVKGNINAIVVSPDAPSLLISSNDGINSYIFIDDLSRAIVSREYDIYQNSACGVYGCYYYYSINSTSYQQSIGLNSFQISGGGNDVFIARSQNMVFDNLQLFDSLTNQLTVKSYCFTYTTVLIEQISSESSTFHVLQIELIKPYVSYKVQEYGYEYNGSFASPLVDCTIYSTQKNKILSQKAFLYNKATINLFDKSFLNYGFFKDVVQENVDFLIGGIVIENGYQNANFYSNSQLQLNSSTVIFEPDLTYTFKTRSKDQLTNIWKSCLSKINLSLAGYYKTSTPNVTDDPKMNEYTARNAVNIILVSQNVTKGLMCIEASNTTNQQKFIFALMNLQTLNYFHFSPNNVTNTDFNLWPYTRCSDRSIFDNKTECPVGSLFKGDNNFKTFFKGSIDDPDFNIARKSNYSTINLIYERVEVECLNNSTNDFIYLDFEPNNQKTYGFQNKSVQFNYQIGLEVKLSWYQQLFFMESCQPENLIWQLNSQQELYPLYEKYYYTQGPFNYDLPKLIVTNNNLTLNISGQSQLKYNLEILVNGNLTTQNFQIIENYDVQKLTVEFQSGIDILLNITIRAVSIEPYFYLDSITNITSKSYINISSSFLNLFVVNNLAPYFEQTILDQNFLLPMKDEAIIVLPDIFDDDSTFASIKTVKITGGQQCKSVLQVNNLKQMTQNSIIIRQNNNTNAQNCYIVIILEDNHNLAPRQNVYKFKITFIKLQNFTVDAYQPEKQANNDTLIVKLPNFDPIWIESVSMTGIVTFRFGAKVFVPNQNSSLNSSTDFLNQTKIELQMISLEEPHFIILNWTALSISELDFQLQIQFENPLKVSKMGIDQLSAKFLDNNLFIVKDGFLFFEANKTYIVQKSIPKQFLTTAELNKAIQFAKTVSEQSPSVVVIVILISIFGKKLITFVWFFYCAIQLVIYMNSHLQSEFPITASIVNDALEDIITLNSTKNYFFDKVNISQMKQNFLFSSIGGLVLFLLAFIIIAIFVVILLKVCKGKLNALFLKVKNSLFWNFFLRYFYASYLNFAHASINKITNQNEAYQDKILSAIILLVQSFLVILLVTVLTRKKSIDLRTPSTKQKIGMAYNQLDVTSMAKRIYSCLFFIQRICVVFIVMFTTDYGLQQALIQLILMAHLIYLLQVQPYENPSDIIPDFLNEIMLLVCLIFQLCISPWQSDLKLSYQLGALYPYIIAFFYSLNIAIIIFTLSMGACRQQQIKRIKRRKHAWVRQTIIKKKQDLISQLKKYAIEHKLVQTSDIENFNNLRPNLQDVDFEHIFDEEMLVQVIKKMKAERLDFYNEQVKQLKKIEKDIRRKEKKRLKQQQVIYEDAWQKFKNTQRIETKHKISHKHSNNSISQLIPEDQIDIFSFREPSNDFKDQDLCRIIKKLKKQNNIKITLEMIKQKQSYLELNLEQLNKVKKRDKREQSLYAVINRNEEVINKIINYKKIPFFEDNSKNYIKKRENFFYIRELNGMIKLQTSQITKIASVIQKNLNREPKKIYNQYQNEYVLVIMQDYRLELIERLKSEIPLLEKSGEPTFYIWQLYTKLLKKDKKDKKKYDYLRWKAVMIQKLLL